MVANRPAWVQPRLTMTATASQTSSRPTSPTTPPPSTNNGDGTFTDVTFPAGLGINADALGWGAVFADVDNHGYPDLLIVNGHVYPEVDSAKLGATFREPRFLYRNLGNGKFADISKTSGPGLVGPASGPDLAIADLWNDGRLEAVVNNLSDLPNLLVNQAEN